jgi:8-oxo-dGTP pyrophosphatase MutT (NUDIX family)
MNPQPSPVSAVILLKPDGSALFQLRDEKPGIRYAGLWAFPGGHADPGEDARSCARREFLEETGYDCRGLVHLATLPGWEGDPEDQSSWLYLYYDLYDGVHPVHCYEGQELRFIARAKASRFRIIDLLIPRWDDAIAAWRQAR